MHAAYSIIIDHGNSTTKIAIRQDRRIIRVYAIPDPSATELERILQRLPRPPHRALYASVARTDLALIDVLNRATNGQVHQLNDLLPLPIEIAYDRKTIGADRVAAAVGAYTSIDKKSELLIIDAGTCITVDRVSAQGHFLGGNISPGISMRLKALHQFTRQLPLVESPSLSPPAYGSNTIEAIQAGVINGIVHELNGYIHELHAQYPDLICVLTGGHTFHFDRQLKNVTFARKDLVLIGLAAILDYQYERCIAP